MKVNGQKLREVRSGKGLTQRELAIMAGVDDQTISHMELGKNSRAKTIIQVSNALNINPSLICKSSTPAKEAVGTESTRQLCASYIVHETMVYCSGNVLDVAEVINELSGTEGASVSVQEIKAFLAGMRHSFDLIKAVGL